MSTSDIDRDPVNDPVVMFVLTRRTMIVWGTPLAAVALTALILWIDGWNGVNTAGFVGLAATIYGALLALFIFLASTANKTRLAQALEASSKTIKGSYDPGSKQSPQQLAAAKKEFAGYVKALRDKYPAIPEGDMIEVKRADGSEGRGNRPVFITTRRGHEYSIWYGGPKSAYYVTDLGGRDN